MQEVEAAQLLQQINRVGGDIERLMKRRSALIQTLKGLRETMDPPVEGDAP